MKPLERILLLAVALGVLSFDIWTVRSSGDPWDFGKKQNDYYNRLIEGWRDGQLAMKVDVPPALLNLADPYDPAQRPPGLALHDASFYHGKYYLYFGVAPVVVLMLPFRLLTGIDLPLALAVIGFVYGAFLASAVLWLRVRRKYFPESGAFTSAVCVLALGVASLGPVLLRRPHMWELPIAGGYCFAMLTLLAVFESLQEKRGSSFAEPAEDGAGAAPPKWRMVWFASAGLLLGLAIASRPTYLVASPMLLAPLAWWWREQKRAPVRELFAAALPLAVIGGLMALHNFLRFGDPLQFGQAYQLSLDYESKMPHFRPGYAAFNAWRYFFSAARWAEYFPFISPATLPSKPAGFGGYDDVYGLFANLPFAWFALAAPLALWGRAREERGPLLAWLGASSILFLAMACTLLCFFGSLARYELDFAPALILLACVGLLACERLVQRWPRLGRVGVRIVWSGAALAAVAFGALFSLQVNGLFAERNFAGFRSAARLFNHVPAWIQRLEGARPAAWEIEFWLPRSDDSHTETLLSVGDTPDVDRVFIRTLAPANVQLGLARSAMPDVVSAPIALSFLQTHRVRITLGAFLPPDTHPWFAGAAPDEARLASRLVRLELDGQVVVQTFRRFEATAGGRVRAGVKSLGDETRPRFTGQLIATRQVPVELADLNLSPVAAALPTAGDAFELKLKFPTERLASACEPLLVSGAVTRGDMLGVEYLDESRVRFVFDHWGSMLRRSEPVRVDRAPHDLVVRLPWLNRSVGRVEQPGDLTLQLDGATVWTQRTMGYLADPEEIAFGKNPIGGSVVGPGFTGEVLAARRFDPARESLSPAQTVSRGRE